MTGELRAVNAALLLGDRAVPPRGTEVAGRLGYRRGHIGHVEGILYADREGTIPGAVIVRWQGGRRSHVEPADLVVRKVPDNAPPFEAWVRLR